MVCDLTLGKEKWEAGWAIAQDVHDMAAPMMNRAMELATEDSNAFDRVMEGYAMPKNSDEEKDVRSRQFERRR